MTAFDMQAFTASAEAVALQVSSADLPGLLSKRLTVPEGCVALVRDEDGREDFLRAGGEATGRFTAVLVKTSEVVVPIEAEGLPTRDGLPAGARVLLALAVPARAIEVRLLRDALLRDYGAVTTTTITAHLILPARTALAGLLAARTAEEVMTEDVRRDLEARLREELKGPCFAAGLDFRELRHAQLRCERWERERARAAEAREREAELERRERLQELAARLERNEVLKKQEVEEFAKVLQYEGLLKELSLRGEVDRRRREEELKRFEAICDRLGRDETKALVFLLEDERLKADLIERLIERDMTEEQIRARRVADIERRLEARLEEISKRLAEAAGIGGAAALGPAGSTRTRRLFAVLGKQVAAFEPGAARDAARETYDYAAGALGFLRSARLLATKAGRFVCAGAQRGIYVTREGEPRDTRELRFPWDPQGQGGANAVAYVDGYFYATHSELGLFRWDAYGLARPEQVLADLTARNDATRGATVAADGRLYFSSGKTVYALDVLRGGREPAAYRGAADAITSFVVGREELFAGTRGGRVLRWALADPAAAREVPVRKNDPIFAVRLVELRGEPHLLVGAKDHGVTAVGLERRRVFDYRASDRIRWVDGAGDYVYGVSRGGYAIHVFDAARPDAEAFVIRVADRVQDIVVDKEPARTGIAA